MLWVKRRKGENERKRNEKKRRCRQQERVRERSHRASVSRVLPPAAAITSYASVLRELPDDRFSLSLPLSPPLPPLPPPPLSLFAWAQIAVGLLQTNWPTPAQLKPKSLALHAAIKT